MTLALEPVVAMVDKAVPAICPALQLVVVHQTQTVLSISRGSLDPLQPATSIDADARFDLASVTKLFTTTALMRLIEQGLATLDQPLFQVLPDFDGVRPVRPYEDPLAANAWIEIASAAGQVDSHRTTFRDLLTHTSGLPAWRPLLHSGSAAAARRMAVTTDFACAPGEHVLYSDIGLILLGLAVERIAEATLDRAIADLVLEPLALHHTHFRPNTFAVEADPTTVKPACGLPPAANCAPTETCTWRGRRIQGIVHDENACRLGGVSGHAGLFSTAQDVARFGQTFLDSSSPVLSASMVAVMTSLHAAEDETRKGLGFQLWSPDPETCGHPFSSTSFGHTGFTGTSLWIDPQRSLAVALLTNEVHYGRRDRKIGRLRFELHQQIVKAVDAHP